MTVNDQRDDQAEITALHARVGRLLDLLREVEWAGEQIAWQRDEVLGNAQIKVPSCPSCQAIQRHGHEVTCRLREELWA